MNYSKLMILGFLSVFILVNVSVANAAEEDDDKSENLKVVVATGSEPSEVVEEKKEDDKPKSFIDKASSKPKFKVSGQAAALFELQDEIDKVNNTFSVSRARIGLKWRHKKAIKAVIKFELSKLFSDTPDFSILRDAYLRFQPLRQLAIRIGQFKKPFGKLALEGFSKRPLIERGESHDYLIEHLAYGDRDIGIMLEGRLIQSLKLDYAIGAFNGNGLNIKELGLSGKKDLVWRLEIEPVDWLGLGIDGSYRFIEEEDLEQMIDSDNFDSVDEDAFPNGYTMDDFKREHQWMKRFWWMYGVDVTIKPGDLKITIESMFGRNWWFDNYRYIWSGTVQAAYMYKLKNNKKIKLEPALSFDTFTFLNTELDHWRIRNFDICAAINLHLGNHTRIMLDGKLVRIQGQESDVDGSKRNGLWPNEFPGAFVNSKSIMLQAAFEI